MREVSMSIQCGCKVKSEVFCVQMAGHVVFSAVYIDALRFIAMAPVSQACLVWEPAVDGLHSTRLLSQAPP